MPCTLVQHFAYYASAHSNSGLIFPNNINRHTCYLVMSGKSCTCLVLLAASPLVSQHSYIPASSREARSTITWEEKYWRHMQLITWLHNWAWYKHLAAINHAGPDRHEASFLSPGKAGRSNTVPGVRSFLTLLARSPFYPWSYFVLYMSLMRDFGVLSVFLGRRTSIFFQHWIIVSR